MATQAYDWKEKPENPLQPPANRRDNCPACEGFHSLQRCFKFRDMSNDDRVKILRRDNICFNCFIKGHYAVGCAQPPACTVENCRSKHQPIMHRSFFFSNVNQKESTNETACSKGEEKKEQTGPQCNVIGVGDHGEYPAACKVFLKVVPVKIRNPTW